MIRASLAPRSAFRRLLLVAGISLAAFVAPQVSAASATVEAAATVVSHFAPPESLDLEHILPPPPAMDTLAGKADLESVLQAQRWRTDREIAWAKRIGPADMFIFADVLGAWFTAANLPLTAALIHDVGDDVHLVGEAVKGRFARRRPYQVDPNVVPCVGKPSNDSYPSGHTMRFFATAEVLAEIFPEKRAALLDFAHRASWGRVWGGVHFPSDIVGGLTVGQAVAAEVKKSPLFQQRLEQCREEILARAKSR